MIQPTSLAAYEDLQETLTLRQRRVLVALHRYRTEHGEWPTAYELFEAMHRDDLAKDLNDTRPRLTELKTMGQVENPTVKRHCRVTNKRSMVWRPVQPERLF